MPFLQMIIDIMGYHFYCASPTVRCQLQHGEAELPIVDFFQLRHGMGLTMLVHHDTPLPSEDSWEEDEAIDLLQRSMSRMKLSLEASITSWRCLADEPCTAFQRGGVHAVA